MFDVTRFGFQIVAYAAFAALIGYFSNAPEYLHLPAEKALIKLNFTHAAERKEECRRLTQAELEQLAPNMRREMDCPRERVPLRVELLVDGEVFYQDNVAPSGLSRDGAATVYQRFPVAAGDHEIYVRLRDSGRSVGFDYEHAGRVTLQPGQNFVIDFRAEAGGFRFL